MKETLANLFKQAKDSLSPHLEKAKPYLEKTKPYANNAAYYSTKAAEQALAGCAVVGGYAVFGCQKAAEQCGAWHTQFATQTSAPKAAEMSASSTTTATDPNAGKLRQRKHSHENDNMLPETPNPK